MTQQHQQNHTTWESGTQVTHIQKCRRKRFQHDEKRVGDVP